MAFFAPRALAYVLHRQKLFWTLAIGFTMFILLLPKAFDHSLDTQHGALVLRGLIGGCALGLVLGWVIVRFDLLATHRSIAMPAPVTIGFAGLFGALVVTAISFSVWAIAFTPESHDVNFNKLALILLTSFGSAHLATRIVGRFHETMVSQDTTEDQTVAE